MKNKSLRCPFCNRELFEGKKEKYETIADHVSDPNMDDYPLRETWICTCKESDGCFWDSWGDLYSSKYKYREGLTSAINSGARECDEELARERKLRKSAIGRLILKIKRTFYMWKYRLIKMRYGLVPKI